MIHGRPIIGYVVRISGDDGDIILGKRGRRLLDPSHSPDVVFRSEISARSHVQKHKARISAETSIMPVYMEPEENLYIRRGEVWSRSEESFELVPRKRPARVRKDPFKHYDRSAGRIPQLH